MNRRQRKKDYQKKRGYNPGEEDRVQQMIRDMVEYADRRPCRGEERMCESCLF